LEPALALTSGYAQVASYDKESLASTGSN